MNKKPLYYIFGALILAVVAGLMTESDSAIAGVPLIEIYGLIGKIFLNALNVVMIPLVAASIITGTARMAADGSFRVLGVRTLLYFVGTTSIAVVIAFLFGMAMQPGVGEVPMQAGVPPVVQGDTFHTISEVLTQIVPKNILAAAANGQIIGVIVFSLVFGLIIPTIEKRAGEIMLGFWDGLLEIMMRMTRLVIKALPFGVFGLVAKVVAETGFETLGCAAWFCLTTLMALGTYAFVVLPLMLYFIGKVNPWRHFQAMAPALLTAFTTSSSAATIPVTIECLEKRAGVSERLASFIVPLGASLNMCGSAIYIVIAVLTIGQAYGIDLSISSHVMLILMTILLCTGEAGIPSASLVAIVLLLQMLQIPAEGIGIALIVDRFLDMCRTPVTVFGNSCCAVFVARSEVEDKAESAVQAI